jgi:hypothetical protein
VDEARVARLIPKLDKMYQMNDNTYQMVIHIPNVHKILKMTIIFFHIFQSKALQTIPKLGFLI